MRTMKTIEVGCAIIRAGRQHHEKKGHILISQRVVGDFLGGYWEFPGGKREEGESIEDCLIREAMEELGVHVKPQALHSIKEHRYPGKKLIFHFYFCEWISGEPQKIECQDVKWVHIEELTQYLFPPADVEIIQDLITRQQKYFG